MISEFHDYPIAREDPQILLDGAAIKLPPGRRSLSGIRHHLETLATQQRRVLCSFRVDGKPAHIHGACETGKAFAHVAGQTVDLDEMPLRLVTAAREQAALARTRVYSVITLVRVNEGQVAREFWWDLAGELRHPLLTLCLLPFDECQGGASLTQLHKWQLEQLAMILRDVDEACWSEDQGVLSHALEQRVLPWLYDLQASLELSYETLLAGSPVAQYAA